MFNTTVTQSAGPWLVCFKRNPAARIRLFCFPYAGGGARIYRRWHESLPEAVEIFALQLPGRGNRLAEPLFSSLAPLLEAVAQALIPYLDKPFAFFGHSMGAILGFELASKLRSDRGIEPMHLFVSGRRAPQIQDTGPITYNLPEPEFIEDLGRLNGTPREILENPELMRLMIPVLRADFQICQTYAYSGRPPLGCEITAFGGSQDSKITREHLEGWREHTVAPFSMRMLSGDHFFLHSCESSLLEVISKAILPPGDDQLPAK